MIYSYGIISQRVAIPCLFVTINFASFILLCSDQNEILHYITKYSNQNYNDQPIKSQLRLINATVTSKFINISQQRSCLVTVDTRSCTYKG